MMSARTYKAKFVEPIIARFKSLVSTLFARYFKAVDSYHRLNITNGNLMLPDLLPAEEEQEANIGVWGMRHKRYLKQNHKVFYYNLLTSGKLNSYLADIEQQAQQLFLRLVKQMAEREGVTEKLKADNQMAWVARMNDIRSRAT